MKDTVCVHFSFLTDVAWRPAFFTSLFVFFDFYFMEDNELHMRAVLHNEIKHFLIMLIYVISGR